jgi:hypothetical protein
MPESDEQAPKFDAGRLNIALGLVALLALGLGFWQLRTLIYSPFAPAGGTNVNATSLAAGTEGSDVQALKNRDTDSDGLSDYDEIYLYHTSAYLKDTDSDGIDDKTEITQGSDPACPQGQSCTSNTFKSTTGTGAPSGTTPTAEEIRAFLKNNGATSEQLAKYDDATLIKLYSEVGGSTGSTTTTPKLQLTAEQKAKLTAMSGAELRTLLRESGVDEASLSQFDDATLQALVKQVINQ